MCACPRCGGLVGRSRRRHWRCASSLPVSRCVCVCVDGDRAECGFAACMAAPSCGPAAVTPSLQCVACNLLPPSVVDGVVAECDLVRRHWQGEFVPCFVQHEHMLRRRLCLSELPQPGVLLRRLLCNFAMRRVVSRRTECPCRLLGCVRRPSRGAWGEWGGSARLAWLCR